MKRLLFLPLLALAVTGCTGREILTGIATIGGAAVAGGATGQAAVAAVKLDEDKVQTRVRLATAEADRMTEYFVSGRLPGSTSPDTAHPKFCPMVIADFATIGALDDGGHALAHGCRIQYHLGKAKDAYEDGNAAGYDEHVDKADTFISQLTAILNRYKGASQ